MGTTVIKITGIDNSGNLTMDNNGNATVDINDTVKWQIQPQSGVASISITPGSPNIWIPGDPQQDQGSQGNWKGVISSSSNNLSEDYTITGWPTSGDKPIIHDPKISVNP